MTAAVCCDSLISEVDYWLKVDNYREVPKYLVATSDSDRIMLECEKCPNIYGKE